MKLNKIEFYAQNAEHKGGVHELENKNRREI